MPQSPIRLPWPVLAIIIVAAMTGGAVLGTIACGKSPPCRNDDEIGARLDLISDLLSEQEDTWRGDDIYRAVAPSVVKVTAIRGPDGSGTTQGSGFVYRSDGTILTNHHVVDDADQVLVTFYSGDTERATVVGADPYSDLAVLRVEGLPDGVYPVVMGNSTGLEPGDRVIAIGNPFGLSGTMTTGIVSQTGRLLVTDTDYAIPAVIQIDAAINPGNSGGPLLSFSGEVVGMTTAIRSETGEFSGIGFAVPSNLIGRVADAIISTGTYDHPWLGLTGWDVTPRLYAERELPVDHGWYVQSVIPGGPSEAAGIHEGDVITGINGRRVLGLGDILSPIELFTSPGDTVTLAVNRNGVTLKREVTLGVRPAP
ncbi:MAG: S1C family serine protease [Methanoculleaceae archaeon]